MRRLAVLLVVVSGAGAALLPGYAGAAPARAPQCAHPTTLTGYEGTASFPSGLFVQQDVWTQQGAQTMRVCSPSSWTATVNQRGAPATGVKTYPDTSRTFTDWSHCASQPRVDSFTKLDDTERRIVGHRVRRVPQRRRLRETDARGDGPAVLARG
jgi:hypothetical protein